MVAVKVGGGVGDLDATSNHHLLSLLGPKLIGPPVEAFHQLGDHQDHLHLLLDHQVPEVVKRTRLRCLGRPIDVGIRI